jgi:hypothetical protein
MSIPRQKTPKEAFAALGAVCLLCAVAIAIAAGIKLKDSLVDWELIFICVLAFVNGLALIWLGEWTNWMKTRVLHVEQDIPPPKDADVRADPDHSLNRLPSSNRTTPSS